MKLSALLLIALLLTVPATSAATVLAPEHVLTPAALFRIQSPQTVSYAEITLDGTTYTANATGFTDQTLVVRNLTDGVYPWTATLIINGSTEAHTGLVVVTDITTPLVQAATSSAKDARGAATAAETAQSSLQQILTLLHAWPSAEELEGVVNASQDAVQSEDLSPLATKADLSGFLTTAAFQIWAHNNTEATTTAINAVAKSESGADRGTVLLSFIVCLMGAALGIQFWRTERMNRRSVGERALTLAMAHKMGLTEASPEYQAALGTLGMRSEYTPLAMTSPDQPADDTEQDPEISPPASSRQRRLTGKAPRPEDAA